ncbi:unnamed protein product [Heligmosomoides polygyrus]|uniref:EB domain-containing protein n=1 Tax=Heligmosomoides polygyrus TaxID=6339 RepID=A0A183FCT0_HELPZ|nr:unnamed protein product [Heligmosomoides polygyrus]
MRNRSLGRFGSPSCARKSRAGCCRCVGGQHGVCETTAPFLASMCVRRRVCVCDVNIYLYLFPSPDVITPSLCYGARLTRVGCRCESGLWGGKTGEKDWPRLERLLLGLGGGGVDAAPNTLDHPQNWR